MDPLTVYYSTNQQGGNFSPKIRELTHKPLILCGDQSPKYWEWG